MRKLLLYSMGYFVIRMIQLPFLVGGITLVSFALGIYTCINFIAQPFIVVRNNVASAHRIKMWNKVKPTSLSRLLKRKFKLDWTFDPNEWI